MEHSKKILIGIVLFLPTILNSQSTTSYGNNAGSSGNYNSLYGYYSGNLNSGFSGSNSFFGAESGKNNYNGTSNSFFGRGSGYNNNIGSDNSFFGKSSGYNNTSGQYNVFIGALAGLINTTGSYNSFLGYEAGRYNTAGNNTFVGYRSGYSNTSGTMNVFTGYKAGYYNIGSDNSFYGFESGLNNTASANTFIGAQSGAYNTTGDGSVYVGYHAGLLNQVGSNNTMVGKGAGAANTSSYNSFFGGLSGVNSTTGTFNSFFGYYTGQNNGSGINNSFFGSHAGGNTSNANDNSFFGSSAGWSNTTGFGNSYFGYYAGGAVYTGSRNTYIGHDAGSSSTGSDNVFVGYSAHVNGSQTNTIGIGFYATPTVSNQVVIGNSSNTSYIVYANWTNLSDVRFKSDIRENVTGLNFINLLKPVSYALDRSKIDDFLGISDSTRLKYPEVRRQVGFIAQDVEKLINDNGFIFSGVDIPEDSQESYYGLRYAEFVVPLVKAVQELSAKLDAQQQFIESLQGHDKNNSRVIELNESQEHLIDEVKLFGNQPNPFKLDTKIRVNLPKSINNASIIIYNLEGKQLKSYPLSERGEVSVTLHGNELPAGMYLYTLVADGIIVPSKRMILTD